MLRYCHSSTALFSIQNYITSQSSTILVLIQYNTVLNPVISHHILIHCSWNSTALFSVQYYFRSSTTVFSIQCYSIFDPVLQYFRSSATVFSIQYDSIFDPVLQYFCSSTTVFLIQYHSIADPVLHDSCPHVVAAHVHEAFHVLLHGQQIEVRIVWCMLLILHWFTEHGTQLLKEQWEPVSNN